MTRQASWIVSFNVPRIWRICLDALRLQTTSSALFVVWMKKRSWARRLGIEQADTCIMACLIASPWRCFYWSLIERAIRLSRSFKIYPDPIKPSMLLPYPSLDWRNCQKGQWVFQALTCRQDLPLVVTLVGILLGLGLIEDRLGRFEEDMAVQKLICIDMQSCISECFSLIHDRLLLQFESLRPILMESLLLYKGSPSFQARLFFDSGPMASR